MKIKETQKNIIIYTNIKNRLIYDKIQNRIIEITGSEKIKEKLTHTLLFLYPNPKNIDLAKIKLKKSPYIIKYKNLWYNTYNQTLIKYSSKKYPISKLYKLKYIIPKYCDLYPIYEYIIHKKKKIGINRSIIITTEKCNLNCYYCFEKNKKSEIILDTKKYEKLWRKINKNIHNKFKLHFFGGEPLLNTKAIFWFTKKLRTFCIKKKLKYSLILTSNLTLLTKKFIDFFNEDEFSAIYVTLDGTKKYHNIVKGHYNKILNNIRLILPITKKVVIRINITKDNYHSIKSLIRNLSKYYDKKELQKIAPEIGFVSENKISKNQFINITQYVLKHKNEPIVLKPKIISCPATFGAKYAYGIDGYESPCSRTVGTKIKMNNKIFFPKKCISCKYYPVCGGICKLSKVTYFKQNWHKCAKIKEQVKYLLKNHPQIK